MPGITSDPPVTAAEWTVHKRMLSTLVEFAEALRRAGIPASTSEVMDAARGVEHVPLERRPALRAALAATLVKSQEHRHAFDVLFDLYFAPTTAVQAAQPVAAPASKEDLQAELHAALTSGGGAAMGELARRAVDQLGRIERSREWFSFYEVARGLDLTGLAARLEREANEGEGTGLERRLTQDEFERRVAAFRRMLLTETRRRVAEHRGAEAVAAYAVDPLPRDVALATAPGDLEELHRAVRPLARKLATRVAMKRRRSTRGAVDVRRTIRQSLSTGGAPLDLRYRHRPPHRPELVILCDVSSSVARFARFALMLTHSLSAQFRKVRSFAFVDTVDEVTSFFEDEDFAAAMQRMSEQAKVVWNDGRSDYGSAFAVFAAHHGDVLGPKTTLLILGDARTNYRQRRTGELKAIAGKARHTLWLNPEPQSDWDTGDSAASEYAACVDKMVEVRNLRQLERFIEREL